MPNDDVIRTKQWSAKDLLLAGCKYYQRQKQLVMAARLPEELAPLRIEFAIETVVAQAGDVICFEPGEIAHDNVRDYEHWPVQMDIFAQSYTRWDEPNWHPTATQKHLMQYNCRPYYKHQGVWARRLDKDTYVESLESERPHLIPAGMWLLIGASGEPYHASDEEFRSRYLVDAGANSG